MIEGSRWIQDKNGLWWELMPVGPFPEPRELTEDERIQAAVNYMKNRLALRIDQLYVQAGQYESYVGAKPEDDYTDGLR